MRLLRPHLLADRLCADDLVILAGAGLCATPRFTVVIACYDSARYVCQAVDSVLSQRRDDVEIVVVDDGSRDRPDLALGAERCSSLLLCRQPNQGLPGARNSGIALARGQWIVPLDADDYLEPGFFDALAACADASPGLQVVAVDTRFVGEHPHSGRRESEVKRFAGGPVTGLRFLRGEIPGIGRSAFRIDALERVGGYDAAMLRTEDMDLVLRLFESKAAFGHCMQAIYAYRQYGSEVGGEKAALNARWGLKVVDRALSSDHWSAQELSLLRQWRFRGLQQVARHEARSALLASDTRRFFEAAHRIEMRSMPAGLLRHAIALAKITPGPLQRPLGRALAAAYAALNPESRPAGARSTPHSGPVVASHEDKATSPQPAPARTRASTQAQPQRRRAG